MTDIRVASFNASLNRGSAGELITDLSTPDNSQAQAVAEIIQRTDADIILINEFDFDAEGAAAGLFRDNYLGLSQNGQAAVDYPFVYVAPSNTGVPSGFDLDNSGAAGDFAPGDAQGFGFFEGQFGFVIFSKHEIDTENVRSFQNFLWKDMPGALLPEDPEDADGNGDTTSWYTAEELEVLRLSSKNHVDVPVIVDGETVHVLAAHPTPPVFDGAEDRNGTRNHDEIRFWSDYVTPGEGDYIYDDAGGTGGLGDGKRFVIVGDYNADPFDGDSIPGAAQQIIENPYVLGSTTDPEITPSSNGGPAAADSQAGANTDHGGNPAFDTADFGFAGVGNPDNAPGNLRVDYALPSVNGFNYLGGEVFWQAPDEDPFPLAEFPTSDHRLVYVDLEVTEVTYTLELLHFTDQEANAATIDNIDNLSAVLNALRNEDLGNDGQADNTLTLSSGDVIIPGLFFDASETVFGAAGIADIQIQNELGLQASALGNHEFDLGTGLLGGLIDGSAGESNGAAPFGDFAALTGTALDGQDFTGAAFPYLSANLDFSADPNIGPSVVPGGGAPLANSVSTSVVIEEGGELIGIVGATTPTLDTISSPGPDVGILPEDFDRNPTPEQLDALAAEIQAEVDALLAANPEMNKVILLAHMQSLSIELALAERLEDVDIIVAGGSNSRLVDGDDRLRDGDTAQGVYPQFVTNAGGTTTAVVNTDATYKYVGRLVIDFDAEGNIIADSYDEAVSGAYATDDQGVADLDAADLVDPEVDAITDAIQAQIVATESNVFGVSEVFLNGIRSGSGSSADPDGVRTQETNLGNLTADANLAYANQMVEEFELDGGPVLVSFKNGGGIRASIGEIVVPGGQVEAVRVPNSPVLDADGTVVKPEGGISQNDIATTLAFNNGLTLLTLTKTELVQTMEVALNSSFPHVAGIKFSYDPDQPEGSQILSAGVFAEDGTLISELVRDGEIVGDPNETFRVVTLNFLANGGSSYPLTDLVDPNRIDLIDIDGDGVDDAATTGAAVFAADGSEQDALAEYLFETHNPAQGGTAFNDADTGQDLDERIQNVDARADTVLRPTIFDIAETDDRFDILEAALVATGLDDLADDPLAELTVFAPTDDGFALLAQDLGLETNGLDDAGIAAAILAELEEIAGSADGGLELLSSILSYHVAPEAQTVAELQDAGTVATAQGGTIEVNETALTDKDPDVTDPVFVEVLTNITAANGLVHGIDRVLLPIDLAIGGEPSIIEGTGNSDTLFGTSDADEIRSFGGQYDRMFGDEGADDFVFGAETMNGMRERDVILDYEVGIDRIILEDGATVSSIRETSSQVVVFFEGDRDAVYVRGEGVTAETLIIEPSIDIL